MRSGAFGLVVVGVLISGCSAGGESDPESTLGSVQGAGSGGESAGGSGGSASGGSASGRGGVSGSSGAAGASGASGSAGRSGSGGAAGSTAAGGSSGQGGGSGGSAGGGALSGCSGADIVCDDFEAATIAPAWRGTSQALPVLSSERARSGGQSLLFAPEGNVGRFLTTAAAFPAGGELHLRAFVNFELGTVEMSGHTGFIVGATADSNGQELRLGQSQPGCVSIDQLLDLNHIPSDATMCSSGHVSGGNPNDFMNPGETLQADTWYCVETFWDTNIGEFRIWVDGRELEVLHATSQSWCPAKDQTCTPPNPWPIDFTMVKFGTQVYNGTVGNIWYDDVAYATTRVGCGD
jgi:hypothetical protein